MRALQASLRVHPRLLMPLILCAGVISLAGCPKMPRISTLDASPSPGATPSPGFSPSPSPSPTTLASASPAATPDPTFEDLAVGPAPQSLVIDASGAGYVTVSGDILRVIGASGDMTSASTASLKLQGADLGSPAGLALSGNIIWFTDSSRKQLRRINAGSGGGSLGSIDNFAFGQDPGPIHMDAQSNVWVGDLGSNQIGVLKGTAIPGDALLTRSLGGPPVDLLQDASGILWTLGATNATLSKITPSFSGSTVNDLTVTDFPLTALNQGRGLALGDSGDLWLTATTPGGVGKLMRIDRGSGTPTQDFNLEFIPGRFAIKGDHAWIVEAKLNPADAGTPASLKKVSLSDGEVVKSFPLSGTGVSVFKVDGNDLWVTVPALNTLVKVDF